MYSFLNDATTILSNIKSGIKQKLKIIVEPVQGSDFELDDRYIKECSVQYSCCAGDKIEIGSVSSAQLNLKLNNGDGVNTTDLTDINLNGAILHVFDRVPYGNPDRYLDKRNLVEDGSFTASDNSDYWSFESAFETPVYHYDDSTYGYVDLSLPEGSATQNMSYVELSVKKNTMYSFGLSVKSYDGYSIPQVNMRIRQYRGNTQIGSALELSGGRQTPAESGQWYRYNGTIETDSTADKVKINITVYPNNGSACKIAVAKVMFFQNATPYVQGDQNFPFDDVLLAPLYEDVPMGIFTVDEQKRKFAPSDGKISEITLTAFDNVMRLEKEVPSNFSLGLSLSSLASSCCSSCNLTLDTNAITMINTTYPSFVMPSKLNTSSGNPTYRDVIGYIAELCCACVYASETTGKIKMKQIKPLTTQGYYNTPFVLDESDRYTSDIMEQPLTVSGIIVKAENQNERVIGTNEYAIVVDNNPLLTSVNNFAAPSTPIIAYTPFNATVISYPHLRPLDYVQYAMTAAGNIVNSILTGVAWKFGGSTEFVSAGMSAVRNGYAKGKAFTARQSQILDNMAAMQTQQLSEFETATLALNDQMRYSLGLFVTQKIEQSGARINYYHNAQNIANSTYIVKFGASGTVWTEGSGCWKGTTNVVYGVTYVTSDGNTVWKYGSTSTGDAVLASLVAKKISTEMLEISTASENKNVTITDDSVVIDNGEFEVLTGSAVSVGVNPQGNLVANNGVYIGGVSQELVVVDDQIDEGVVVNQFKETIIKPGSITLYDFNNTVPWLKADCTNKSFIVKSQNNSEPTADFEPDYTYTTSGGDTYHGAAALAGDLLQFMTSSGAKFIEMQNVGSVFRQIFRGNQFDILTKNGNYIIKLLGQDKAYLWTDYFEGCTSGNNKWLEVSGRDHAYLWTNNCYFYNSAGYKTAQINDSSTYFVCTSRFAIRSATNVDALWTVPNSTGVDLRVSCDVYSRGYKLSSSQELKTNIEPAHSMLSKVLSADICNYDYVGEVEESEDDEESGEVGLNSEEEEHIPQHYGLVIGEGYNTPEEVISKDGEHIDLYSMISIAWKAIQEQQAIIDALEQRIAALEGNT